MIDKDKLKAIHDDLEGTCMSMAKACEEHGVEFDDLTTAELEEIEEGLYRCDNCCWWFADGDQDEDGNCPDCSEHNEDEDEEDDDDDEE